MAIPPTYKKNLLTSLAWAYGALSQFTPGFSCKQRYVDLWLYTIFLTIFPYVQHILMWNTQILIF